MVLNVSCSRLLPTVVSIQRTSACLFPQRWSLPSPCLTLRKCKWISHCQTATAAWCCSSLLTLLKETDAEASVGLLHFIQYLFFCISGISSRVSDNYPIMCKYITKNKFDVMPQNIDEVHSCEMCLRIIFLILYCIILGLYHFPCNINIEIYLKLCGKRIFWLPPERIF